MIIVVGNTNLSRSDVLNGVVVFQIIWFSIEKYNAEISKNYTIKNTQKKLNPFSFNIVFKIMNWFKLF